MPRVLFISAEDDPVAWEAHLARVVPGLEFVVHPEPHDLADIEFALAYAPPAGLLKHYPALKGVLSLAAGLDHLDGERAPYPNVPVIPLRDPGAARLMAEYVLAAVLGHHREFPAFAVAQSRGDWAFRQPMPAGERCVGILGLGPMGLASAELLRLAGFRVLAWSRTPRDPDAAGYDGLTLFSGAAPPAAMLERCSILVCLLPLTADTSGILDASLLACLPRGAALVNAGRGAHLVAADLIAALESGQLAAATLDVLESEPPAANDALFRHGRVFVTPHVAAFPRPQTAALAVAASIEILLAESA